MEISTRNGKCLVSGEFLEHIRPFFFRRREDSVANKCDAIPTIEGTARGPRNGCRAANAHQEEMIDLPASQKGVQPVTGKGVGARLQKDMVRH